MLSMCCHKIVNHQQPYGRYLFKCCQHNLWLRNVRTKVSNRVRFNIINFTLTFFDIWSSWNFMKKFWLRKTELWLCFDVSQPKVMSIYNIFFQWAGFKKKKNNKIFTLFFNFQLIQTLTGTINFKLYKSKEKVLLIENK